MVLAVGILGIFPAYSNDDAHDDFVLSISVEKTNIRQGENFYVGYEYKNNSGKDYLVTSSNLKPHVPGVTNYGGVIVGNPAIGRTMLFKANSIIKSHWLTLESDGDIGFNSGVVGNPWQFGHTLQSGTYELSFCAGFFYWEQEGIQQIETWSNKIMLTVLPICEPDCDCTDCTGFDVPLTGVPCAASMYMVMLAFFMASIVLWGSAMYADPRLPQN